MTYFHRERRPARLVYEVQRTSPLSRQTLRKRRAHPEMQVEMDGQDHRMIVEHSMPQERGVAASSHHGQPIDDLGILQLHSSHDYDRMKHEFDKLRTRIEHLQDNLADEVKRNTHDILQKIDDTFASSSQLQVSTKGVLDRINPWSASEDVEGRVQKVKADLRAARHDRDQLGLRVQDLERGIRERDARMEELQLDNRALTLQQNAFETERNKLKTIITSGAGEEDEPLDAAIISAFTKIKDLIQRLVHSSLTTRPKPVDRGSERQMRFYNSNDWLNTNEEGIRRRRLRAGLWNILYEEILSKPCFGIEDAIETTLGQFEAVLIQSQGGGHANQIADWRKRTLQCIGLLATRSQVPERVANTIYDFLLPVMQDHLDESKNSKMFGEIMRLSETAHSFALAMRRTKSTFSVNEYKSGMSVQSEEGPDYVISGFDGQQPDPEDFAGSEILYTLFGALNKVDYIYRKSTNLVKAEVVCRG